MQAADSRFAGPLKNGGLDNVEVVTGLRGFSRRSGGLPGSASRHGA
jgi:hypothetical protein